MRRDAAASLFLLLTSGLALTLLYKLFGLAFFTLFGQPRLALIVATTAGILLPLAVLLRSSPDRAAILRARRASALSLLLAMGAAVAALPSVLALASLVSREAPQLDRFLTQLLRVHSPEDFVLVFVAAALLPAIAEEALFRGFLLTGFERRYGRAPAILATAAWFGAIHGVERGAGAFLLGILFGWFTLRANSVAPAIAAHIAINAVAILVANGWIAGFGSAFASLAAEVTLAPAVLATCTALAALFVLAYARVNRN